MKAQEELKRAAVSPSELGRSPLNKAGRARDWISDSTHSCTITKESLRGGRGVQEELLAIKKALCGPWGLFSSLAVLGTALPGQFSALLREQQAEATVGACTLGLGLLLAFQLPSSKQKVKG